MDVLVVGAGPVGLAAACELARHGVRFRIVDKAPAPSPLSKALGVHARSLEVFERMGVVEPFLAYGKKVRGMNAWLGGEKHVLRVRFDELDSPYPFILDLPQSETEKILTEHLQQFGVQMERGVELVDFTQSEVGVNAVLRHPDGREETAQAAWLIGTDGAHSTVRHRLNAAFDGSAYPDTFVLADVRVDWELEEGLMHLFSHDQGLLAAFPYGDSRYRLMAEMGGAPHDSKVPEPTLEEFQQIVDTRCPVPASLSEPVWLAGFRSHLRHVRETRHGRVFLAGDASHIHSPAGGQGMNTGIQDAFNLVWKLALVVKGQADASLLDTYPAERLPVAESVLKLSDTMLRAITEKNPLVKQVRNHIAPFLAGSDFVQHRMREQISEIAIHYRGSPIVSDKRAKRLLKPHRLHAGDRAPDVDGLIGPDGGERRLYELLRGTKHALLIVAGKETLAESELSRLERWRSVLDLYEIGVQATARTPTGVLRIVDPDRKWVERYDAEEDDLLLIRPDGYIGYIGDSRNLDSLELYLEHFLIP